MAAKTIAWFMIGTNPKNLYIPIYFHGDDYKWLCFVVSDDVNRRLYELFNAA